MKSALHDSILQYGKELKKYSHKISPRFKAATIHRFRTTTKKLRSLLHWQKIQKDILPASFVKMYHTSGELRNAQIVLVGLNHDKINLPDFMLWLATFISGKEMDWNEIYHKRTLQKLEQKLSRIKFQKPAGKALRLFFSKRIYKLQAVLDLRPPADDMLHEVRKMVKDMQYIKQWCGKNWVPGNNITKKFSLLQLKKLGKLAGNYNDKRMGLILIEVYLDEEKYEKAIKATRPVQKKYEQQKAKLKKQLLGSLRQFCKRKRSPYFPAKN